MRAITTSLFLIASVTHAAPATGSSPATFYNGYQQMMDLVNQVRQQHGVPAICLSAELMQSAYIQSQHQASINTMTHDSNIPLMNRFTGVGFSPIGFVAENVGESSDLNVESIQAAFVAEPEHLTNILGNYTHFGSAAVKGSSGMYYWTQHFAFASDPSTPCMGGGTSPALKTPYPANGPSPSNTSAPGGVKPTPTGAGSQQGPSQPSNVQSTPKATVVDDKQLEQSPIGSQGSLSSPGQPPSIKKNQRFPVAQQFLAPDVHHPAAEPVLVLPSANDPSKGPYIICLQGKCYQVIKNEHGHGFIPVSPATH